MEHQPTLTRVQSRELDRRATEQFGVSSLVLMENAGRGCVDCLQQLGLKAPVVICCGKGNNAGDGLVMARHLDLRKVEVKVLLWADPDKLTGDAAANFTIVRNSNLPLEIFTSDHSKAQLSAALANAGAIVDALLGTGASGEPRPPLDDVIDALNAHPAPVLAIDVPSGLDCDTGQAARHTIQAAHTCTFVAAKPGLLIPSAERYVGDVHVQDIGAPRALVEEMLSQKAP